MLGWLTEITEKKAKITTCSIDWLTEVTKEPAKIKTLLCTVEWSQEK